MIYVIIRINNQIGSILFMIFMTLLLTTTLIYSSSSSSLERDQNRFLYITQQQQIKYEIIDLSKDSFCVLEREIAQSQFPTNIKKRGQSANLTPGLVEYQRFSFFTCDLYSTYHPSLYLLTWLSHDHLVSNVVQHNVRGLLLSDLVGTNQSHYYTYYYYVPFQVSCWVPSRCSPLSFF